MGAVPYQALPLLRFFMCNYLCAHIEARPDPPFPGAGDVIHPVLWKLGSGLVHETTNLSGDILMTCSSYLYIMGHGEECPPPPPPPNTFTKNSSQLRNLARQKSNQSDTTIVKVGVMSTQL